VGSAAALVVRVLIADDHRLFAEALSSILAGEPDLEVVGIAGDGNSALDLARSLKPDVVLMDIAMPGLDGVEAAQRLRRSRVRPAVIVVSGSNAPADVARAREAGVAAYVTKDSIAADLVDAIREAAAARRR